MNKIYGNLLSFFLLLLISTSFYVSALPNGADTCVAEEMPKGAHGVSKLQGSAGYTLNAKMLSQGKFQFTLNGENKFKGILVYVINGNERLGEFTNLPSSMKFKVCDNVQSATVTHQDSSDKNFPFTLNWNAPQGTNGNLTIKSLIVRDFSNWAQLADVKFDPVTGASSSAPENNQDNTTGSNGSDFLSKYLLFIIMIGITTILYIVGSVTEAMLKRQQVKSRSFANTIKNGYEDSR